MMKHFMAIGAAAVAVVGQAGIKYWDNPAYKAFDVDDYVAGAVWNFDGIRNVGETEPHSNTTTTWVNLGTDGSTYNATPVTKGSGPAGEWTDDGYWFKGGTRWYNGSSVSVSGSWTVQMLVDADVDDLLGNRDGPVMSAMGNTFAFWLGRNIGSFYASLNAGKTTPYILTDSHAYDYATVIVNNESLPATATMFSGTKPPTSGNGYKTSESTISGGSTTGWGLGSTNTDGQQMVGILKSFRWYKRVLTEEELAWNRVVDERRFFDRAAPLPVTNAVIATSVAGAEGTEPAGCYAVDGSHEFTVSSTVNVDGIDYVCTGYTVETLGGEGWTEPVFHKAVLFQPVRALVTETDCVRITWQWAKADGLNLYTIHDYVWDGLEVFYDGICNQGTNVAHSATATNWVNLGTKGNVNDMFIQRLNTSGSAWETATNLNAVGGRDPGCWTEHGFALKGDSRFRCNAPGEFNVGTSYSLQMLVDAKASDQGSDDLYYLLGANNDTFAFRIKTEDGNLYWRYKNNNSNMPYLSGGIYDYITAIMRADNKQTFFSGTMEPTSGNGYKTNTSYGYSDTGFCFGGYGKNDRVYLLVGTLKNFRQYDHALDPADVVKNRAVDNWRYFGIADVTNVIVQSTVPYLRGDEPGGPYAVAGGHIFTAPATVTVRVNGKEITYACDGCIVETWDGSSTWTNATSQAGNSYTYTVGSSPERVRLTWKWKATRGLRTAADYSFDDYSQAGLLWNYDGIRNQGGTDADHDSSATTWKNLGSGGSAYDLHWNGATSTGAWTDNGYRFAGGPRFKGDGKIGPLKNFTLQTLIDADIASQTESNSKFSYIMNAYDNYFNISLVSPSYDGSAESSFCWKAQGGTFMYFHAKDNQYDYATAIMDYDAKKAMMFPGTTIPTEYYKDGTYGAQRLYHEFGSVSSVSTTGYGLGNRNNNGTEGLVGTIKNFRYYDRVLTEEELVRNRNVDSVRYFGELGVTNVLVQTKYADVAGDAEVLTEAPGAYKVEGSWTFSATSVKDENGTLVPVVGYYTEELVGEKWINRTWHAGTTYTYTEGTAPATIRLTWRSPLLGARIILR